VLFGEKRVTTLERREESVTTLLIYIHQTCKTQALSGRVIGVTGQERCLPASPPRLAGIATSQPSFKRCESFANSKI